MVVAARSGTTIGTRPGLHHQPVRYPKDKEPRRNQRDLKDMICTCSKRTYSRYIRKHNKRDEIGRLMPFKLSMASASSSRLAASLLPLCTISFHIVKFAVSQPNAGKYLCAIQKSLGAFFVSGGAGEQFLHIVTRYINRYMHFPSHCLDRVL